MKTKKHFLSLLIVTVMISFGLSCRKEPAQPVNPDPAPVIGKLAKLEYEDGSYDSLFYNSDLQLSKLINHSTVPAPYDEVYTLQYDSNKKIYKISDNNGEYFEYKYVSGLLTAVNHYAGNTKNDYKLYDYVNGKLTDIEEYYKASINSPGYELISKRVFSYFPDGNLRKEESYSFDQQTRVPIKEYSIEHSDYDDKFNTTDITGHFLFFSQVPLVINNPRRITTRDERSGFTTDFHFEYTYNSFSNPLTKKMSYTLNGQTHTETVKYYYY